MKRREFITLLGGAAPAWPLAVRAQQPQKLAVIGILVASPLPMIKARAEAFRRGLRDLGYIEQRDVILEWRSAEGQLDRLPALARELVRLKVDVIVAAGGEPPALASCGNGAPLTCGPAASGKVLESRCSTSPLTRRPTK